MVYAEILAGGIGTRFGSKELPKQYHMLLGKPIVVWSMLQYQRSPEINSFVIVADIEWHTFLKHWIKQEKLDKFKGFAKPGICRQASVRNGMLIIAKFFYKRIFLASSILLTSLPAPLAKSGRPPPEPPSKEEISLTTLPAR